jgi:mRNA turnover protein 4
MPRSKRAKIISLTKVQKEGHEGKAKLVRKVQKACERFEFVWVFKVSDRKHVRRAGC